MISKVSKFLKYMGIFCLICLVLLGGTRIFISLNSDGNIIDKVTTKYMWSLDLYPFVRTLLLFIFVISSCKIIQKNKGEWGKDDYNDEIEKDFINKIIHVILIFVNIIFLIFPIAKLIELSQSRILFSWHKWGLIKEIVFEVIFLIISIINIIWYNNKTLDNFSERRRMLFEYIFGFGVIFIQFLFLRDFLLFTISHIVDGMEFSVSVEYWHVKMENADLLTNVLEIVLAMIVLFSGMKKINKVFLENASLDDYEKKSARKVISILVGIVLIAYVCCSFGTYAVKNSILASTLREDMERRNSTAQETMRIISDPEIVKKLKDSIYTEEQIEENVKAANQLILEEWCYFVASLFIPIIEIIIINKNSKKSI